jgi:hypothetical protein
MHDKRKVIKGLNDKIFEIVDNWGFVDEKHKQIHNVEQWLMNFDHVEIPIIFNLLPYVQLKRDLDTERNLNNICKDLERTFNKNFQGVYFFSLGDNSSSSGSQFLYKLRGKLNISENNFKGIFTSPIKNAKAYIFIDDFIGSGNQASKYYNEYLKSSETSCYYYALYGYEKGKVNVAKSGFEKVFVSEIIFEKDKIFSLESTLPYKAECKKIAHKYGSLLYKKHPLGYEDSQALLCFIDNCPNNTLPIIWAGFNNEMEDGVVWNALFERKKVKSIENDVTEIYKRKKFVTPKALIDFFYDSLINEEYEHAFYCFSEKIRAKKYNNDLKYFQNGYKNTGSLKGKPLLMLIESKEDFCRVLIHYHETARIFQFKKLTTIYKSSLGDLANLTSQLTAFKKILINSLNVNEQKVKEIPFNLFFSANAVEDACWTCGVNYEQMAKQFPSEEKSIARVKYIDCKLLNGSWEIDKISPVFPSSDPYL